jgi:hypothetical protein
MKIIADLGAGRLILPEGAVENHRHRLAKGKRL